MSRDRDALHQIREALFARPGFIETVLRTIAAVVVVVDADGRIIYCNPAAEDVSGWRRDELLGQVVWDVLMLPEEAAVARRLYAEMPAGQAGHPLRTTVNHWRTKDGRTRLLAWSNGVIDAPDGEGRYSIATGIDITERHAAEEQLAFAATHDDLTGLANRPMLLDRLAQALARREGRSEATLAVLFIDLDGFKAINDELGHQTGDRTLQAVAQALSTAVRPADTVARFGGDEFVVVAEDLAEPADADALAERLRDAVSRVQAGSYGLRASIGVMLAWDGATPHEVIRRADEAMYRAKRGITGAS